MMMYLGDFGRDRSILSCLPADATGSVCGGKSSAWMQDDGLKKLFSVYFSSRNTENASGFGVIDLAYFKHSNAPLIH